MGQDKPSKVDGIIYGADCNVAVDFCSVFFFISVLVGPEDISNYLIPFGTIAELAGFVLFLFLLCFLCLFYPVAVVDDDEMKSICHCITTNNHSDVVYI